MDALARLVNKYIRRAGPDSSGSGQFGSGPAGRGRPLAFTGCCDEHDLFYEQGLPWQGWGRVLPWLRQSFRDRAFADRILRKCIAQNLRRRGRPRWVRLHVPWCFWLGVRLGGWWFWKRNRD